MQHRIGIGYDVHQLREGIPMVLGGVTIPHNKGPLGHSDGDVLIHAICDALLGATALGDIGQHFPDNSEEFRNIDSKILLERTSGLIANEGFSIGNIDSTVCLQQPRISSHIPSMKKTLSGVLKIDEGQISIKATTTEGLGIIGEGSAISAYAVALLKKA
ncbi:2-C-methyl-D-erythritol 2,4-cyclodiphosphate synthase [subsurface metagenome]